MLPENTRVYIDIINHRDDVRLFSKIFLLIESRLE